MATYYIDNAGSDSNTGLSGQPWQTCSKVTSFSASPGFAAGDVIVFTAGQTFAGPLTIVSSGSSGGGYICIGTGRGTSPPTLPSGGVAQANPAIITIADGIGDGLRLDTCEYVWLDNIRVQGSGVSAINGTTGSTQLAISLRSSAAAKLNGVRLTALTATGCKHGMTAWVIDQTKEGWDDLRVWGCRVTGNQQNGMQIPIGYDYDNPGVVGHGKSTNLYLGYCEVDHQYGNISPSDVAGQGYIVFGATTVTVEHCVAHDTNGVGGGGARGSAGFEFDAVHGLLMQYCEAYGCGTTSMNFDGEGLDLEGENSGIVQFCYFHHNYGAGILGLNSTLQQEIRYNVLANNNLNPSAINVPGASAEFCWTAGTGFGLVFYGNTVYGKNMAAFSCAGAISTGNVALLNNIIVAKAGTKCLYVFATNAANILLWGNLYYTLGGGTTVVDIGGATYNSIAALRADGFETSVGRNYGVFGDPLLRDPDAAPATGLPVGDNFSTVTYFDILAASPAAKLGFNYTFSPGTVDFHGNPNGSGGLYDAGAVEISANAGRGRMR